MATRCSSFCGAQSSALRAAAGVQARPVCRGATAAVMRKPDIHPEWHPEAKVFCNGVEVMTVGGTRAEYNVDVYSGNHPFYQASGAQRGPNWRGGGRSGGGAVMGAQPAACAAAARRGATRQQRGSSDGSSGSGCGAAVGAGVGAAPAATPRRWQGGRQRHGASAGARGARNCARRPHLRGGDAVVRKGGHVAAGCVMGRAGDPGRAA